PILLWPGVGWRTGEIGIPGNRKLREAGMGNAVETLHPGFAVDVDFLLRAAEIKIAAVVRHARFVDPARREYMRQADYRVLAAANQRKRADRRIGVRIALLIVGDRIASHQTVFVRELVIDLDVALLDVLRERV